MILCAGNFAMRLLFTIAACGLLACLVWLLLLTPPWAAPPRQAAPPPGADAAPPFDPDSIEAIVHDALRAWQVPGVAVAIIHNDEVVYLKGHGVKELGKKDPVTPDTLFPIASCTKAFTTTAMAMLVDEGKMAWDDPVRKHVDYFHLADPLADANVTLRDLVTHRTGVRGHELLWYRSPWTQEEIIRKIGLVKLDRPFRSSFQYQTTMFTTAGHAVASAAKMPWAEFVQKRILDPLEMTATTLTTADVDKTPDHATPHRRNRLGSPEPIPWYRIDVPEPAGSINSTARDLARWVQFHLGDGTWNGKRLVSAASFAEPHTPQNIIRMEGQAKAQNPETLQMSYGMAWVVQDYRGHLLFGHAGAIDGFRAHLALLPRDRLGIVLLNNLHETRMNQALANNLIDRLLGLGKRDWNSFHLALVKQDMDAAQARFLEREASRHHGTKPSRELTAYVGRYEEPAYGTAEIALEEGTLVWKWSTFRQPLRHFHYNTFTIENDLLNGVQAQFALGPDGEVATLRVEDPLGVEFKKVRPR
jgi:CubicO group peptidase (beta-lactamase class C family)